MSKLNSKAVVLRYMEGIRVYGEFSLVTDSPAKQAQYATKLALRLSIEREIEPKRLALLAAEERLIGGGQTEAQGYVYDLDKCAFVQPYSVGRQTEPDLATENEPRYVSREMADRAEQREITAV